MAHYRSGYGGYRGRRTFHDILKIVAIVLAVLVVLLLVGLFAGQRFLVFTDGGIRVEWPWAPFRDPEPEPPLEPGNVSVVIQPEGSGSSSEEEPVPAPEERTMAALQLPVSAVLDGTAAQQLEAAGANALILEMKDQEGKLGWVSAQPAALRSEVNSGTAGVNEALRAWNQGNVYTVARVCCFRDNSVPYHINSMATRKRSGNWRDELGLRWLSPDSADARAYLTGLCAELAGLGFDEIVLESCSFPTAGNLGRIVPSESYESNTFQQTMEGFLDEVKAAVAPYGTALSVRTERGVLSGETDGGGITAAGLESRADRLWLERDGLEPALPQLLAGAGLSEPEKRLVELVPALEEGAASAQAALGTA